MDLIYLPIYIFIFLFGIVFGSFLNVCIYRIPKHETIVTVPSHCMSCGYKLKWYDLVPVFSWLFLRGKCRNCGQKISAQYPIIETVNGIAYVLIALRFDLSIRESLVGCAFFSVLLVLAIIDWRTYEIPIGLNIFILVLAGINLACDYRNWLQYVIGFFAVSLLLYVIWLISKGRAIGGGDVKLMAAAGLLLGWQNIILAFALGCIIGAITHLIRMKVSGEGKVLAMGPYLAIGLFISYLFGSNIIQEYIAFCTTGAFI